MSRIIITGITGQDGSYMAEYCLALGHEVYGIVRRTAQIHDKNFKHLYNNPKFHREYGDLSDFPSILNLVRTIQPDYFINFAAQSFVKASWEIPEETFMVGAVGVLKCLEAVRKECPTCRFYNAGSSEQFGDVKYAPQDESHPFRPRSPYAAAKCAASHLVKVWRESYHLYAIQGLLFNHESERRGGEFVTRKITKGIARIFEAVTSGKSFSPIELGNLDSKRDWSHAKDFVDGVWRMLNQELYNRTLAAQLEEAKSKYYHLTQKMPDDVWVTKWLSENIQEYILASGETFTIRYFVEKAFAQLGIYGVWEGHGMSEKFVLMTHSEHGMTTMINKVGVIVNPEHYRPAEVSLLLGNSDKARQELSWKPQISLDKMIKIMVESDLYESGLRPKSAESQKASET